MADKGDKTEKPTPKKKKDARKKGNIARTQELGTWTAVLVASFVLPSTVTNAAHKVRSLLYECTSVMANPDEGKALHLLGKGLETAALAVLPLALTMMGVGVVCNLAQVGFAPTTAGLKPKFSKLNPATGLKRVFSKRTGVELAKSLVKLAVLGAAAYQTINGLIPAVLGHGSLQLGEIIRTVLPAALGFVRTVAAIGLVIAAVDYFMQYRRVSGSLKMSKHDLKEEAKTSEGNPLIKGAQKRKMMQMSRLRMMAEAARADAVIVNPTHYAVAIKYETGSGAPRVIAKGTDEVALKIREIAEDHEVPVVEDIPLARTLWRLCDIGAEIPADMYEAVARLLAFVYAIKAGRRPRPTMGAPIRIPGGVLR